MQEKRESVIVNCLVEAFSDLMEADPDAFRTKFRKMAADPFAFYRGSACVFYADVVDRKDRWADERTSRVWIQGDLHAENFGTYVTSPAAGCGRLLLTPLEREGPVQPAGCYVRRVRLPGRYARSVGRRIPLD
jgi:hypothetical protein